MPAGGVGDAPRGGTPGSGGDDMGPAGGDPGIGPLNAPGPRAVAIMVFCAPPPVAGALDVSSPPQPRQNL